MSEPKLPDDLVVLNCAECGRLCSRDGKTAKDYEIGLIRGEIKGHPWCKDCLTLRPPPPGSYGNTKGDTSPGWENGIRALEGD